MANTKIRILENLCRTCMEARLIEVIPTTTRQNVKSLISIYHKHEANDSGSINIMELIQLTCPQLTIEDDDMLPKNICESCLAMLVNIHEFHKKSLRVEKMLRNIIKQHYYPEIVVDPLNNNAQQDRSGEDLKIEVVDPLIEVTAPVKGFFTLFQKDGEIIEVYNAMEKCEKEISGWTEKFDTDNDVVCNGKSQDAVAREAKNNENDNLSDAKFWKYFGDLQCEIPVKQEQNSAGEEFTNGSTNKKNMDSVCDQLMPLSAQTCQQINLDSSSAIQNSTNITLLENVSYTLLEDTTHPEPPKKRKVYVTSHDYNEKENKQPLPGENNSASNQEVIALLNIILQKQDKFEEITNSRLTYLEKLIQEKVIDKTEIFAQTKMIREGLVVSRQMLKATERICGESLSETELGIKSILPLLTPIAVADTEARLLQTEFETAMQAYLFKLKGLSGCLDDVVKQLVGDCILDEFNWDGRCGKRSLRELKLFKKLLFDTFSNLGWKAYEKEMRKSVELSHNRNKHKKREATQSKKTEEN